MLKGLKSVIIMRSDIVSLSIRMNNAFATKTYIKRGVDAPWLGEDDDNIRSAFVTGHETAQNELTDSFFR